MKIDEAIARLEGINCAGRGTSCPDQLAKALRKIANEQWQITEKAANYAAFSVSTR